MAASRQTPDDLRRLGTRISGLSSRLKAIAASVESAGMDGVWLQVDGPRNTFIPKLEEWLNRLEAAARNEVAAFTDGRPSPAERNMERGLKYREKSKTKAPRKRR